MFGNLCIVMRLACMFNVFEDGFAIKVSQV